MAKKRRHLGEILYKAGIVEKTVLLEAIKESKSTNKRLGEILVDKGVIDDDTLAKAIAKQFKIKYVDVTKFEIPDEVLQLVPERLVKKHNVLPLGKQHGKLKIAITDPLDLNMLDELKFNLNIELDCRISSISKIREYIDRSLETEEQEQDDRIKHSIDTTAAELAEAGHDLRAQAILAQAAGDDDEGPIVKLANLIIDNAYRVGASDIHIEPMADRIKIRYRVDGVCMEKDNIPKNMQAPLMARLKIMSGMDIAERRLPQDGRIKRSIDGTDIDFRVSALPAYHGESMVLRILDPESVNIGVQSLGFEPDNYKTFQRIIKRPNGIFLVTGPTGSGKTTTLYAALQELNTPNTKIITAEDPVEYNFAGMNQCQINEEIGLTFDSILRSMLRQAPNIILIGEIRDTAVAEIAVQAALTGHLVFSTLHTNDAISAITRLIDMGIKPFLVASSIQAIMAQRLVRVICQNCKMIDDDPDPKNLRTLNMTPDEMKGKHIYKGAGCSKCQGTGFKGRKGIFEMIELTNQVRELAFAKAPTEKIREAAVAGGMRTLLDDGKIKIFKGITTPAEIAKIAQA